MTGPEKVGDLKPAPYNPREMSTAEHDELERSMREFGDLSGIIWNRRTGHLVGAHQRIQHIDEAIDIVRSEVFDEPNSVGTVAVGYLLVDDERWRYREVDVDLEREKAMNLAANKHSGRWVASKLGEVLGDLSALDLPLGFSTAEIEDLTWDPSAVAPIDDPGKRLDELSRASGKVVHSCPHCGKEFTS